MTRLVDVTEPVHAMSLLLAAVILYTVYSAVEQLGGRAGRRIAARWFWAYLAAETWIIVEIVFWREMEQWAAGAIFG